ncbi:hypothetical protein [Plantactinospora sp. KBS50]|uniref:hypothetical protein n=1 Tax=Plantactinospora sp. KBS50 TaxID=2024580 RepID=UPI000BAA993D|nr:hypothetical protein [Plantactinospora sp. KBS50]ASW55218.1 hypothetical protein CIK06_15095 [Plantactinospora sp. KBS50]
MGAPATSSNDQEPPGRRPGGDDRLSPYDLSPPRSELEFRDHHLRRATDDEARNRLYIRLRWHQVAMAVVCTAAGLLPIVVIIWMSKWAGLSADQIMNLIFIASGGTGLATAGVLLGRHLGRRANDGRAP